MATLKLAVVPAKQNKDGSHKIRVAIGHKQETRYVVTKFKIENLSNFKNGQVTGYPDAAIVNVKLRNLLNAYQEKLDAIKCVDLYTCSQLRELLVKSNKVFQETTFQAVANRYVSELNEDSRNNYAILIERNCRYFTEFAKGELQLAVR